MNQDTLETHILDLLDGLISPENVLVLENALRTNPEAIETYLALSRVENLLNVNSEIKSYEIKSVVPMERILQRQRSKTIKLVSLSTAALILFGVVIMSTFFVNNDEPILSFKTAPDTQFSITHRSDKEVPEGLLLEEGSVLKISQGTVNLLFESGVTSIVSAPAELKVITEHHIHLKEGSAWFEVPSEAVGFQVTSKNLNIVDLGTEFGVHSRPDGEDEIHVFKGSVSITTEQPQVQTEILTANEGRITQDQGKLKIIQSDASEFLTTLPNSLPHIYWSFDDEDGFKAKGSHPDAKKIITTPNSSTVLVPGKVNQALSLNGKGQYLTTNWYGILGNSPRSLSCWIKLDPDSPKSWGTIIEWGDEMVNGYWRCRIAANPDDPKHAILRLGCSGITFNGSSNLADGKWHHIVIIDREVSDATEKSQGVEFYVDGEREQISINGKRKSRTLHRNTQKGDPAIIGSPDSYTNLAGEIDELHLFYGAITDQKIKELSSTNTE